MHWSDGHLDVTKKLNIRFELRDDGGSGGDAGRQAAAGGGGLARRIRRQGGVQRGAAGHRVLQNRRQAEFAAVQEAGSFGKSEPAGDAVRAAGVCGDRGSIFYGGVFAGRHGYFVVALDAEPQRDGGRQADQRAGSGDGGGDDDGRSVARARVRGAERSCRYWKKCSRRWRSW